MPHKLSARSRAGVLFATASAVAFALLATIPHLHAEESQPARKDTSIRAKPKDAELTTSIEPAEAAPGDVVEFKVSVKLGSSWHIYTYADVQRDEGPRHTLFDLFQLDGLEPDGPWTASKEPEAKPEPAFENQTFEYFEDDVVWSIPLKVPANATPGERSIKVQASYQICNANSCSMPGRWTLPAATLTVLGEGQARGPAAEAVVETGLSVPASAETEAESSMPAPKKKDTPEPRRPKGIVVTSSVEPADVPPGGVVNYKVTVKIDPGLHLYDVTQPGAPGAGPTATAFDVFDPAGLKPSGEWTPSREPTIKPEPAFGDNVLVASFEDEVSWSTEIKVPVDAAQGERSIRTQILYQLCTATSCYQATYQTLPDVVVKISGEPIAAALAPDASQPATSATSQPVVAESSSSGASPSPSPSESTADDASIAPVNEAPISEIARTAQQGLLPFLIASALGGLFALVMPCVWPMVPITVNFFLKQGKGGEASTTGLAIAYCLSIIGVFTLVGVLFSFFFSAAFLQNLANNPWLNLVVAGLFLAFGLSLLGVFEIRLPNFLLNASARGESRGGLIGVIFMALTLTITSFTCTFPVVGGLLVMASRGDFFYPIIGLATFASVIALPFFLLALAPGLMSKMPRSGDWMNSVKVVGGLVEIGAALKFLNTAELGYVTPENAWFDAQVVLTAWIILSAVCGVYLLGLFRTDHDYDEVKVGAGRILFGCLFLGLALFMMPALFGRPPQSLVWDRLIVGILPPDSNELMAEPIVMIAADGVATGGEVKATSSDPAQAEREQKSLHGVLWGMSLDQAKEEAAAQNRPILIDFTGVNCANCRLMERNVLPKPDIVRLLKEFVTVQLYTDRVPINSVTAAQREEMAMANQERQLDLAAEQTNPFYVIMAPDGNVVASIGGYNEPLVFQDFLVKALNKLQGSSDVAQVP